MKTEACSGCGKPIVWAEITKEDGTRGRVPLDPRPACYLTTPDAGDRTIGVRDRTAMVSHFATCPNASDFSGSKRKDS